MRGEPQARQVSKRIFRSISVPQVPHLLAMGTGGGRVGDIGENPLSLRGQDSQGTLEMTVSCVWG